MHDYSPANTALIVVTLVISAAVVYMLAQPTDLPEYDDKEVNRDHHMGEH